jgi:hypothetical protein
MFRPRPLKIYWFSCILFLGVRGLPTCSAACSMVISARRNRMSLLAVVKLGFDFSPKAII